MSWITEQLETVGESAGAYLETAETLQLGLVDVLRDAALVAVPLSVALVPGNDRIIPVIDRAVELTFARASQLVRSSYVPATAVADRLSRVAA